MVSATRPEWQNIRCITVQFGNDACSSENTCLREAPTLCSTSSMDNGIHKLMGTTDLAFHVFSPCGEIQWLGLEFPGIKPLPMFLVSHIHQHYTTFGDLKARPADVTNTYMTSEACMSDRSAGDLETTGHIRWESVV